MTHRSYSLCQQASSGQDGASKNIYMTSTTKTRNENNNMRTITRTATESSTGVFANIYTKTSCHLRRQINSHFKGKSVISLKEQCHEMNIFFRGL
jgi:hypothetical protein